MSTRLSGDFWGVTLLRRSFRLESRRFEFAQGLRAALGISVPAGMGLILNQLPGAMVVTLATWLVLLADVGGAYRQKALTLLSATLGIAFAVVISSLMDGSVIAQSVGMFIWIGAAAFVGIYGNSAATVSFTTSLMFVIAVALPYPHDLRLRFILCVTGGLWALSLSLALWPLHAFTSVLYATAACYEKLSMLLESALSVTPAEYADTTSLEPRFPTSYESLLLSVENARQAWTAVRVRRAGPSARSMQLLALIETAAQLGNVAVVLHEQHLVIAPHPRFQFVGQQIQDLRVLLARLTREIARAIQRGGATVDASKLSDAQSSLNDAFEALRSSSFREIEDYAILVHLGNLSRAIGRAVEDLRAGAEIATNLATGRLQVFSWIGPEPAINRPSVRLFAIFRNNLTLRSLSFRHAIRLGTLAALSFALGELLHLRRGYWMVVTVLVVLKPNFGGTIERVIQRIGGTIIGSLIALLIGISIRQREVLFLCIALLAFLSFSVRQFGYGVFTLALTPLFLVLLDLANPGDWGVDLTRIGDTLIGGLVGLGGSFLLFPIWETELLPMQLARTLLALKEYFDNVMSLYLERTVSNRQVAQARRNASLEVANAAAASQRLLSEPIRVREEMEPSLTIANYARRFMLTLTALDEHVREYSVPAQSRGLKPFAREMSEELGKLADILKGVLAPNRGKELDGRLEELRDDVESLSATRLKEFAGSKRSEVTPTVVAIREQSVIFSQLQRLVAHTAVLSDAVVRLKGASRDEKEPA